MPIPDGVSEGRVIQWRPRIAVPPPANHAPEYVWTMVKQDWRIDCVVEEGGRLGWNLRVFVNHRWFFRCAFPTYVAAVDAAEIKYAELVRAGWTPAPIAGFAASSLSSDPAFV